MYEYVPDLPENASPMPHWVEVVLFGPFLAVLLSVLVLQIAPLSHAAQDFFLIASASFVLGFLSVSAACIFHLFRRLRHRNG